MFLASSRLLLGKRKVLGAGTFNKKGWPDVFPCIPPKAPGSPIYRRICLPEEKKSVSIMLSVTNLELRFMLLIELNLAGIDGVQFWGP